jgi:hypothetical protein
LMVLANKHHPLHFVTLQLYNNSYQPLRLFFTSFFHVTEGPINLNSFLQSPVLQLLFH